MSRANSRRTARIRTSVGASVLALGCIASAQAQVAPEEIVVTATRAVTATKTDTPILHVPQSITIVTAQQLEDRGAQNIRDALLYAAGVTNSGDDSRGDFNSVRGFESVLYLDGLKRNFGFVYLPRPDINTLDRVELLLGPASVLYGSGSSGGLTNMQSKRPKFEFGGSASVNYGTYNRKEAAIDITGPLSETLAARIVGVVRDSDVRLNYISDDRIIVQPSLTWKPGQNTEVTLIGLYQKDEAGPNGNFAPLAGTLLAPPGREVKASTLLGEPSVNGKNKKEDGSVTLLVNHQFSDAIHFHSASRYNKAKTWYGEIYPAFVGDVLNPFIDTNRTTVARNIFAIDVRYRSLNSDNNLGFNFNTGPLSHKLLAGVDYSYFRQIAAQAFDASTPINVYNPVYGRAPAPFFYPATRQVLKQLGYYAQDQIDFGEYASLVLGIRRDRVQTANTGLPTTTVHATTKRAGLTINVTPTIAPYVSFSESFQPVSGLNQFNQAYVPLEGKQKEAGIKWQPLRGTLLRVAYYHIKETNNLQPDPVNPLSSIQTGSIRSKGFEFQADHDIAKDLTVTASYSHNASRQSGTTRQADLLPKDTAKIFGTKTLELNDGMTLRFGGGVRYVGRQTAGDAAFLQVVTPNYTVVDAMAAIDYQRWSLQLNAINLFDKDYYSACSNYGYCQYGDPRTIRGTLTYRF